jgi:hypothetical protein
MSQYRYLTSNILTGQITGDWLPMTPQSFVRTINAVGAFTGALNLAAGTPQENRAWVAAVECEKSVLWIDQDNAAAWCGIIWDWPHQSILDNTLPISASTPESLFQHRQISDDLTFTDIDIFDLFRALATYALSKSPNGQMAGFTMGSNQAGVKTSITYNATDLKKVYDAWTDLISTYDFEYSIRPVITASGTREMSLDLGFPEIGLPLAASGLAFNFPGDLLDYRFPRTGSSSANRVTATASVASTPPALNAEWDFEDGIGPWTGLNGAGGTLAQSSAWSATGTFALSFHGNGSTANPLAQTEHIPVTGGTGYSFTPVLWSSSGWSDTVLSIVWYDATGTQIGSPVSCAALSVAASTPLQGSVSAAAPSNAVTAVAQIKMTGTPSSGILMLADAAVFSSAAPLDGNWVSELPHGQDSVALGAGYPLLEDSVSLTTATVASQAQIDAYADGELAAMTGTQLTPVLVLGAGQRPAVTDIVLGSWCQFNATSPLHPANDDGSPGLQLTGRIVSWAQYPPSQNQAEYAELTMGQVTDTAGKYAALTGSVSL